MSRSRRGTACDRCRRTSPTAPATRSSTAAPPGPSAATPGASKHEVTRRFAEKTDGIPNGTINEGLFATPMTAHVLGGCPYGRDAREGVIGVDAQVHNYPGLYAIDGSMLPANPSVNPSLTITAMAELAMSHIPPKPAPNKAAASAVPPA